MKAQGPTIFRSKGHLLVCTGPQCAARGGQSVFRATEHALEANHLVYYRRGGVLRLTESGCLGGCQHGPVACLYLRGETDGAFFHSFSVDTALAIGFAVQNDAPVPNTFRFVERSVEGE